MGGGPPASSITDLRLQGQHLIRDRQCAGAKTLYDQPPLRRALNNGAPLDAEICGPLMDTGLCSYQDLEKALNRARNKKDNDEREKAEEKNKKE